MDDNFLYQLREEPHPEFAIRLYDQLSLSEAKPALRSNIHALLTRMNTKSKLVLWVALIAAGVMFLATISPVRALVQELLTSLAGQSFLVTEEYPHYGDTESVEPLETSLDEALAIFPYRVNLPTYIPDGFVLDEDSILLYTGEQGGPFSETIIVQWKPAEGAYLTLQVSDHDWNSTHEVVAPGAIEEIPLTDGSPAVLIHGGWNFDRKAWDTSMGLLRLRWQTGGLNYDLHSNVENIAIEQLIMIASSTLE